MKDTTKTQRLREKEGWKPSDPTWSEWIKQQLKSDLKLISE